MGKENEQQSLPVMSRPLAPWVPALKQNVLGLGSPAYESDGDAGTDCLMDYSLGSLMEVCSHCQSTSGACVSCACV